MQGIVGSGIAFALMSWCIQVRGPLYVSMFSPLLLVVVAIFGWAILGEKIHVGRWSLIGTPNKHPATCSLSLSLCTSETFLSICSSQNLFFCKPLKCSAIGSALIVAGLYMVLWGKGKEMNGPAFDDDEEAVVGAGLDGKGSAVAASTRDAVISMPVFGTTSPKHDATRNGNN
jgi:hypothetical protein